MAIPVRATLADLIALVRLNIGDAPGGCQNFGDADIQLALDERREEVRYEVLFPQVKYTTSGYQYLFYKSRRQYWESDEELIGPHYQTLTPATAERVAGFWTFPAGTGNGQYPPVFLAGKAYDVNGATADLLARWRAVYARKFDVTTGGTTLHRSQVALALKDLEESYRRRALIKQVRFVRNDIDPNSAGTNDRAARLGPVSAGVPFITGD